MYHKENSGKTHSNGCTSGERADSRQNIHVLARAEFVWEYDGQQPETLPESIFLRITADDYYKLYVNGRYAGQGPAPSYPEHSYYNELDLMPFLQQGRNILALHLYYQGLVNRVWNSGDGRFGIACEICICDGTKQATHRVEPVWRYQVSDAYTGDVTGYDTQFLENFDSRRWEENWKDITFDDSRWKPMVRAEWADYQYSSQPAEMLSVYHKSPYKVTETPDGWFIDMGQEITGALLVWATAQKDGSTVVVRCGEELEAKPLKQEPLKDEPIETGSKQKIDGGESRSVSEDWEKVSQVRYRMRCSCRYEEVWTLRKGACHLEPYDYKGFRYAELLCGPDVKVTHIEAEVRHYPMDETLCTLSSDDPVLDGIFRICKNGVKYGTQEGYLDCPTREKGQYLGDAVVAARSQVWLTGDVRMLRKCIDQFAWTRMICPGLMAVAPGSYMQEIADFSLLWSQLLLTDYQFTGDKEILRKYYPVAKGIIDHFRKYERTDGLLEQVSDKWNLVDWPENLRDGYDFELSRPKVAPGCHNVINALYVGAVKTLESIEAILMETGKNEGGSRQASDGCLCQEKEEKRRWQRLRDAYIRAFYSTETGLFKDSTESVHSALHSNIYPLFFGLCPEGKDQQIADFLVKKGLRCGVMTGYFYLKALAAAGRYGDLYSILVNVSPYGWANMLREGATTCWEAWGRDQKWNTSLCHPWASGPVSVIIEDIAGMVPDPRVKSGFRFEPHVPEEITSFRMKVPFKGKVYKIENGYCRLADQGD